MRYKLQEALSILLIPAFTFLACIALSSALVAAPITGSAITGEGITGRAVSQNVGLTVIIVAGEPSLTLHSPKNQTYLTNYSLLLNFSSANASTVWYHLDAGNNITLTSSNILFNTSQGSHRLFLYANNSDGNLTNTSVTFAVNVTKFNIIYEEYRNSSTKGNSNDFNLSTFEGIQSIPVILENTEGGKIQFASNVNLTNISGGILDLDTNTNISYNRIELNGTALPNLDVAATITFYNLTFSDPRILLDGNLCSSVCTEVSYSSGTFVVNVTSASGIFLADESPVSESPSDSQGSSGGGGPIRRTPQSINLTTDAENLVISVNQGENKRANITITNNAKSDLNVTLTSDGLDNLLTLLQTEIPLKAGQSVTIFFNVRAQQGVSPGLYLGKISLQSGNEKKSVAIAIDVSSGRSMVDMDVEVPARYRYVLPGEDVVAQISIFNLGVENKADVALHYEIRNEQNQTVLQQNESIILEKQATLKKTFTIPAGAPWGIYAINVKAIHDGEATSASTFIYVGERERPIRSPLWILLLILIAVLCLLALVIYYAVKHNRVKKILRIPQEKDKK